MTPVLSFHILTLFPEMFPGPLNYSITGKALEKNIWTFECYNMRSYALDKHRTVDDTPYGGGSGMVLRPDIVGATIEDVYRRANPSKIFYMSPRGRPLTQKKAVEIVKTHASIAVLCGRYEGVDQRVLDHYAIEEISIGDYVLSGGELAAYIFMDSCIRLVPDALGNAHSLMEESFSNGLLEYPQFTKPREWLGYEVPSVLLEGHHARIAQWQKAEAEALTKERRPDLWAQHCDQHKK